MRAREKKKREIENIISATVALALMIGFYIWLRFFATLPSREMTVVDCHPIENYWEVVVEDADGNQWAYYADHYTENGVVSVQMDGEEIVNVR